MMGITRLAVRIIDTGPISTPDALLFKNRFMNPPQGI